MEAVSGGRPLEETTLVQLAQRGDGDAFAELVRRYEEIAFRVAYLITRDAAEAEDASQEAFVRSYRAIGSFRLGQPFRPWFLRIVANQALNRHKAAQRRTNLIERYKFESEEGEATIEDTAAASERSETMWRAIALLNESDQTVIYLRYFMALPENEVAAVLRCRPGTVKSRLHRANGRNPRGVSRCNQTLL
jgi:RNA polymerase sigma-70 factor (ECF subfamily)